MIQLITIALAFLVGCSTMDGYNIPLPNKILRLRPGYKNLTHKYCKQKDIFNNCKKEVIEEFESTQDFATQLNKMGFACRVYNKRYKPCFVNEFGFCHRAKSGIEFEPLSPQLVQAGLVCFNYHTYDFMDF